MPGPPPPPPMAPPPMMPPPPPMCAPPSKGIPDSRGALLQSIRQGAKLKKAVTNDRSGPIVLGKPNSNCTGLGGSSSPSMSSASLPNGLALGGLFSGGMPKLRSTGKQLGGATSGTIANNNINSLCNTAPIGVAQTPQKNFSNMQSEVQSALKKQMASDSNRNRGPPPPAPIRNISQTTDNIKTPRKQSSYHMKNGSPNGIQGNTSVLHRNTNFTHSTQSTSQSNLTTLNANSSSLHANSSTLHRKANSSANLSVFDNTELSQNLPARPSNRKPNLAPKPPVTNGKPAAPPKKLIINGHTSGINRAQSMRSPRSPSPQQSPEDNTYPAKFGTVRNLSSVLDKSLGQGFAQKPRPSLNGRPTVPPPLKPPQQMPPPPPSKVVAVKPPNHAPPPPPNVIPQPPNHAPPPPPHRTQPQVPTRAPPAVPSILSAPPPPPRHSSMRDVAAMKRIPSVDLEVKYASFFRPIKDFPSPPAFRGLPKSYASRLVGNKQQAPLPPNHVQLGNRLWDSSNC